MPAHIGETLSPCAEGDPEGSPSDPVTTDPKGEVGRPAAPPQIYAAHNTPALTAVPSAYGARELQPWFVTGLTEGKGCFCIALALRTKMRTGLEVRPSFSLSLNEKGPGGPRRAARVLRLWLDPPVAIRSDLQVRGPVDH
jgi:hypothetical protein